MPAVALLLRPPPVDGDFVVVVVVLVGIDADSRQHCCSFDADVVAAAVAVASSAAPRNQLQMVAGDEVAAGADPRTGFQCSSKLDAVDLIERPAD